MVRIRFMSLIMFFVKFNCGIFTTKPLQFDKYPDFCVYDTAFTCLTLPYACICYVNRPFAAHRRH
jgi:hypothetical protein